MAKPVVITERDMIRTVAERFRAQYRDVASGLLPLGWDPKYIAARLEKLDLERATAEEVAGVIGRVGWTSERCNACNKYVSDIIVVGDVPDFESATATLCGPCLKEAYDAAVASGIIAADR